MNTEVSILDCPKMSYTHTGRISEIYTHTKHEYGVNQRIAGLKCWNPGVHIRVYTFYSLLGLLTIEENSVFIKKGVGHTRRVPGMYTRAKREHGANPLILGSKCRKTSGCTPINILFCSHGQYVNAEEYNVFVEKKAHHTPLGVYPVGTPVQKVNPEQVCEF